MPRTLTVPPILVFILLSVWLVAPADAQMVPLGVRALSPDGAPAVGVEVGFANWAATSIDLDTVFSSVTDERGAIEVPVPARRTALWLVLARDTASGLAGLVVLPPDAEIGEPLELRLDKGVYITSTVLTVDQAPLSGVRPELCLVADTYAWVFICPPSDDEGNLRIGPLPAGVTVYLDLPPHMQHLAVQTDWPSSVNSPGIVLTAGETRDLGPVTIDPDGRSIEGVVVDADGKPVPLARVFPFEPEQPHEPAVTDEQGRFFLVGLPAVGLVWIGAAHPARGLFAAMEVDPDAMPEVEVVLHPPVTAAARFLDEEGRPLADMAIGVTALRRQKGAVFGSFPEFPDVAEPQTDANGVVAVPGLVFGGEYGFVGDADGLNNSRTPPVIFVVEEDGPIDLGAVQPQAPIRGVPRQQ